MDMLVSGGAVLVGIFLLFRQGLPLLKATKTGILVSKGASRAKIERTVDAERFDKLFRQRRAGLLVPLLVVVGAGLYFSLCIMSLLVIAGT